MSNLYQYEKAQPPHIEEIGPYQVMVRTGPRGVCVFHPTEKVPHPRTGEPVAKCIGSSHAGTQAEKEALKQAARYLGYRLVEAL